VTPAALARVAGAAARIEAKLGGAPADLAQGRARTTVAVEALALLRDAATLESDSWLSEINLTYDRARPRLRGALRRRGRRP
jgi:hypothetical protein